MRCESPRKVRASTLYKPAARHGYLSVPCGECPTCRLKESIIWKNRLLLEQLCHGNSTFVTLTYKDKHLPDPPHVNKKHVQDYLKRLRYYVEPIKIRYFIVGEYGDRTLRPHYHGAIFGLDPMLNINVLNKAWVYADPGPPGVHLGELNKSSAGYIAGYIRKKQLKDTGDHPVNYGKADEFSLKSQGLGKGAVDQMKKAIKKNPHIERRYYSQVRVGGKMLVLGRYLKERMNEFHSLNYTDKLLKMYVGQMNMERHKDIINRNYESRGEL